MRGPWFGFNKVVDSDTTNFNVLVDEIVDKIPSGYGDVLIQFYLFTISIGLLISLLYQGVCNSSNQLDLLAITYPSGPSEQHMDDKRTSQQKKKRAIKKITPNKSSPAMATRSKVPSSPSSPAMGTRSKKKLDL